MAGRVHLWLGGAFDDIWREVARPWLAAAARTALLAPAPWVVLVPSRAHGHALKARWLGEGRHLGGVFFWTPGELRDHLRRALPDTPALALREYLHLLLASAAENDEHPAIRAAGREPGRLMRSLDQLTAAGLDAGALDFPPAEQLAATFAAALRDTGWTTVQAFDWRLARSPPPDAIASLLLLGFDAAHWELWPLLQACVGAATEAAIVLTPPRSKAERLDQAWIGSWEEVHGEAASIATEPAPAPFADVAHRMENHEADAGRQSAPAAVEILVGRNVREHADAIATQCLAYLRDPAATRIGLLFPGPSPLAREVSARLVTYGVPHFDAFGHAAPPSSVAVRWQAWVHLQKSYRLDALLRLVEVDAAAAPPARFDDALGRAYGDVLVDDLPVLTARLRDLAREDHLEAAAFLARYARLPQKATVARMLEATHDAWRVLGWSDLAAELDQQTRSLAVLHERSVTVAVWLDWLSSVAPGAIQVREPDAANPLARVHLLPYTQAEGLSWSHLVLADLSEGRWPPSPEPAGYLSDDRIAELNAAALHQGRQGEGHEAVRDGRALLLGSAERREIYRRQFYNLVESATVGLAATCALESEEDRGRVLPPSDFLSHLYFTCRGEPLTEPLMEALQQATAAWLAHVPPPPRVDPPVQPAPLAQPAVAYRARRAREPFGPYECAFASAGPPRPAELSCKQWESAVRDPAGAWFNAYLGVAPVQALTATDRWPITRGTWVHRWLAHALTPALGRFEQRAVGGALATNVRRAVAASHRQIAHAFTQAGREEPQWWRARLAQAEWVALQFARRLADVAEWPVAAAEWTLPSPARVAGLSGALHVRGRIDVLFAPEPGDPIPRSCWVADFKTGNEKPLTDRNLPGRLLAGYGIQICLYALALAEAGAQQVAVSLLTPDTTAVPQVELGTIRGTTDVWEELIRMQDSGRFGIRGEMRAEYGPSLTLPLATLAVEKDLLEEKWALTHPGLAAEEEDDDGE